MIVSAVIPILEAVVIIVMGLRGKFRKEITTVEKTAEVEVLRVEAKAEATATSLISASRGICTVCQRKVAKFITTADGKIVCLLHKGI